MKKKHFAARLRTPMSMHIDPGYEKSIMTSLRIKDKNKIN